MRFIIQAIYGLILAIALSLPGGAWAATVIDQAGRSVEVPDFPRRVVSLAPSLTEIVYAIGREDRLVGATQYSNEPPPARDLPRVGSYVKLDLEKIIALKPDLCLGIKDGNPLSVVQRIEALGIPVYVIDPHDLAGIAEVVERLGALLGAKDRATAITSDMRSRIARINRLVAGTPERPGVFFQIDAAPIISAGLGTFIDELISLAGGRNLAVKAGVAYPRYNWEEIITLAPQVAIVASMAGGYSVEDLKGGWLRWPQIPAVRDGRVHVVEADLIDRPTPRLVEGLERFAEIIHPELFGEVDDR